MAEGTCRGRRGATKLFGLGLGRSQKSGTQHPDFSFFHNFPNSKSEDEDFCFLFSVPCARSLAEHCKLSGRGRGRGGRCPKVLWTESEDASLVRGLVSIVVQSRQKRGVQSTYSNLPQVMVYTATGTA